MKKKYFILSILIIIVVLLIVFINNPQKQSVCPKDNLSPMYGCDSYNDFMSKRDNKQKEVDDQFVSTVMSKSNNDKVLASNSINRLGWSYFVKGDLDTAMKRYNQAWLITQDNFITYWQIGIILSQKGADNLALENFEKAVNTYDKKYQVSELDYNTLICDRALSYLTSASKEKDANEVNKYLTKSIESIEKLKNSDGKISDQCTLTLIQSYAASGKKAKANSELKNMVSRNPRIINNDTYKDVVKEFSLTAI